MKLKLAAGLMITGLLFTSKVLKSQAIAPQLWSNVGVTWNINDRFSWRNTAAFNALLSSEFPWLETTLTSAAVYKFHRYMEVSAGVYTARTKQTVSLSSYELRPSVGFRISTNNEKRWKISNLSRLELRQLIYSDVQNDVGFIHQDAKNNVGLPAQAPTNLITKYIIDWGIVYVIPSKKKD